jgi:hypothetical protein
MTDLKRLRELALKVKSAEEDKPTEHQGSSRWVGYVAHCEEVNSEFNVAISPDAVLALLDRLDRLDSYRKTLAMCIAHAGSPDAANGCRLVIDTARAALEEGE